MRRREVVVCKEIETTALGAAMQAAAAAESFRDIREAAEAMSGEGAVYSPPRTPRPAAAR